MGTKLTPDEISKELKKEALKKLDEKKNAKEVLK
jgi:hypothetical protein